MIRTFKRMFTVCIAFCFVLPLILSTPFRASAAEWEETYYGTQLDYYAGGEKLISVTDSSFADWAGISKVEINSAEHPENWLNLNYAGEITYSYALAWDKINLYVYEEIDKPISSFKTCYPRFYFNASSIPCSNIYFIQYNYNESENRMYISRGAKGAENDAEFMASIGIYGAEINGKTYIEISVPWSSITTYTFNPQSGASLRYNLYVMTDTSGSYLFDRDTSLWRTFSMTYANANEFPTMHFSEGTPVLPTLTPKELSTTDILTTSYKEINAALGKSYTGATGTKAGWTNNNGSLLTEGSFQDINTISGEYMEGYQPSDISGGAFSKTVDLSSSVSGLYKFCIGSAQITADRIVFPSQVKVYASADGYHYQLLGTASATAYESSSESGKLKEFQKYILTLDKGVTARYIRIKLYPPVGSYDIVPISEISAVYNTDSSGQPEESAVVSLGAKINPLCNGLRFGARYNKKALMEVKQLGMLLYPTSKLSSGTLDMNYYKANPYSSGNTTGVILINAVSISASDFYDGRDFKDYNSFVYFVTILNIPASSLSKNITAVPFVEYTDGSIVYGSPLVRNYNAVKAATDIIAE